MSKKELLNSLRSLWNRVPILGVNKALVDGGRRGGNKLALLVQFPFIGIQVTPSSSPVLSIDSTSHTLGEKR